MKKTCWRFDSRVGIFEELNSISYANLGAGDEEWPTGNACNLLITEGYLGVEIIKRYDITEANTINLTHNSPKYVFGVKFSLREIRRIFPINLQNFQLCKMPKLFNIRFPEGWYFLNFDNTELKRSSIINFLFPNGIAGR